MLPIITRDYEGKQLYDHIRSRYKRINDGLKQLGKLLHIRMNLTTYVSRHTMAMTLQGNDVPVNLPAKRWGIVILQRQMYILTVFQQVY